MAVEGLKICKQDGFARELAENHAYRMAEVLETTGDIWENYCSEKSTRGNISMHDYGWSALGATTLLIETVLGIRTYALEHEVAWNPMPEKCGIRRLPYRDGRIELSQQPERGRIFVRAVLPAETKLNYCAGKYEYTYISDGRPHFFDYPLTAVGEEEHR